MKKRILSLFMALALSISMTPTVAFAEEAGAVTEQEAQSGGGTADVYTTGEDAIGNGSDNDTAVEDITGDVSGGDVSGGDAEEDAAIRVVQALIDALPDEVTVENAGELEAQLIAIDKAMEALDEAQTAKLDKTRLEKIYNAMNAAALVATQAGGHTEHPICGNASCDEHKDSLSDWQEIGNVGELLGINAAGNYYLTAEVTLSDTWSPANGVVLCLNGYSIKGADGKNVIEVAKGSTFTLTDCKGGSTDGTYGKITHADGETGSGVKVSGTFNMYGGEISGNTAAYGGGVYVGGTFYMYDGAKISDNHASNSSGKGGIGGGVHIPAGGKFEMHGGEILVNTASNTNAVSSGGGVNVYGTFDMSGGTISGNTVSNTEAKSYGGGVNVSGNGTFNMSGGTISGNTASSTNANSYGGGVCVASKTFTMNGGTISGNSVTGVSGGDSGGGGVCVYSGTFNMHDGTISGNTAENGGGVYMYNASGGTAVASFKIGGGASVSDNFSGSDNTTPNNVYLLDKQKITITASLTGKVGITLQTKPDKSTGTIDFASGDGSYSLIDDDEKAFFADGDENGETYGVYREENTMNLHYGAIHKHKVCVGTDCTDCTHEAVFWTPISTEDDLRNIDTSSSEYYYLTTDISLRGDSAWQPKSGVVLDLCGHSITGCNSRQVIFLDNVTFTLTDCKGGNADGAYGKITHGEAASGAGIELGNNAQFYFYGGSITGNQSSNDGGGIYVNGSKFWMYGGEIVDNSTSQNGGGVCLKDISEFHMYGGRIANNKAMGDELGGGGVCARGVYSTITVRGKVEITDNKCVAADGTEETSNVYCQYNYSIDKEAKIIVDGPLDLKAKIGIDNGENWGDRNIAKAVDSNAGWIKDGNFTSDSDFYKVTVSNDGTTARFALHDHVWGVKAGTEGNVLVECCTVDGCDATGGTLTLEASDQDYSGEAYDFAKVNTTDDWEHAIPAKGEIFYTDSEGDSISAPVKAGTYFANITVGGVTAKKQFTIRRWKLNPGDIEYTAPDPNSLTYDGNRKEATVTKKNSAIGEITVLYYDKDNNRVDPINAGTYTVKIEVAESDGYKGDTLTNSAWTFTIEQKPVTITGLSVKSKTYDGTNTAEIDGAPIIEGLVDGDKNEVTVDGTNAEATFEDANAREGKTVTFTGYSLSGTKAGNYALTQPSVTADITPKVLTIKDVEIAQKIYDGTKTAKVTGVTFDGLVGSETLTDVTDYTANGTFKDESAAGAIAASGDNEVTVTVELADRVKNYTFAGGSRSTTYTKQNCYVSKAAVGNPAPGEFTIIKGDTKTYTITLPSLPTLKAPRTYGSTSYSIYYAKLNSGYQCEATLSGSSKMGELELKITTAGDTIGNIGAIQVKVETDNYADIILTVDIKATDKLIPQLADGTLELSPTEITYGDQLSNITITGKMMYNDTEVPGAFTWQEPDKVLDAGTHTGVEWKFTPTNGNTYAETTGFATVTVKKAAQSGTVSMKNYCYNDAPSEPQIDRQGDSSATVTYYYSTINTSSGGEEWKDIGPTTLDAGTYYMYAVIGSTNNYSSFITLPVEFEVKQAAPICTPPTGLEAKYGQKLGEIELPNPTGNMSGKWSWQESLETVLDEIGTKTYHARFEPDDKNYMNIVNVSVGITVNQGDGGNLATFELTQEFADGSAHTYTPDWSGLPDGQTWSYGCEYSVSNGSTATLTKSDVSAANGELTYAVSGGKAGDQITVTLKALCNNYMDFTITLNIKITQATPAGEPKYTRITTDGKTLADVGLTLDGSTLSPADGTLKWVDEKGNVLPGETKVEVNTEYMWLFTPADNNYKPLTGKVELYHVDAPAISTQPVNASVKAGERAVFEVAATGTDLTYQWKINRNDGNGFVNINGADSAGYTSGITDTDCN